jgi:hypothetical protein
MAQGVGNLGGGRVTKQEPLTEAPPCLLRGFLGGVIKFNFYQILFVSLVCSAFHSRQCGCYSSEELHIKQKIKWSLPSEMPEYLI